MLLCTGMYTGFTKVKRKERPPQFRGEREADISLIYLQTNIGLGFWCLMPISTIFQLYRGSHFNWWRRLEYSEKTIDLSQVTDKYKQYIFTVKQHTVLPSNNTNPNSFSMFSVNFQILR